MTFLLRVYERDECGRDGYPLAWHVCPDCGGEGCGSCRGAGSIKRMIRARDFNRCLRCLHPYSVGEHRMEREINDDGTESFVSWSRCTLECRHSDRLGDLRIVVDGDPLLWKPTGLTDAFFTAATIAENDVASADSIEVQARFRILTVHHLNDDKYDCRWWNLVSLCQRCHLHIQKKVLMARVWPTEHSEWFKPFVAGWYALVYLGEEISEEEARARMDELLALERMA